ncbi:MULTISPECIES: OmpP1/FadL family transporter [Comamonadaceae]|uniref:OmpP1/FadL family transporter n=1 Tax=Comamonadaceae TaxID=80864 RepID=UPI002731C744|nr:MULTISPECIES: outer membrane protein transport protein [Comamonadaceae]MDP2449420.1 outer membrane protein transport protein [Polaromonas sp.]MDP3190898.1 outer membrane protein transport protein [Rhodoferax sp.]MDP3754374.1 outer membrane protein transport protein [Polaromonas sp.]
MNKSKTAKAVRNLAAFAIIAGPLTAAMATNGYFSHGFGIKAKGMGGVGIALPQDALAAATNPAGMVDVGGRVDFGADLFMPDRTVTYTSAYQGVAAGDYRSGQRNFLVPDFGYNRMLSSDLAAGVVVYGNGGMNTNYGTNLITSAGSHTYTNLEQLFIAPTISKKIGSHSFGASLNLVYQTFEAKGLEAFDNANNSRYVGSVTNRGKDSSTGVGLKLGWTGQVSPTVTLGAVYQSRTKMSKLDRYKGLLAEEGGFDIPESYGFGVAVKATPKTTVALDVNQINYGSIKSIANPGTLFPAVSGTPMGPANGSGFGWNDMTVLKLGVSHEYSKNLTLRAGYNHGKMPITSQNTYFNILAPATVEQHVTLGATWTLANKAELSMSYMHAFSKGVSGVANGNGQSVAGYPVNLKMKQNAIGIAYGWKL